MSRHYNVPNLQQKNPSLAKEWHPTKNGKLAPQDVQSYSLKKIWWICESGHAWEAPVARRTKGFGCPYCNGKKACTDNCLQTRNPRLAKEWHPTKNGKLTPRDVTSCSGKTVWWQCKEGHAWKNRISYRNYGSNCPVCRKKNRKKRKK